MNKKFRFLTSGESHGKCLNCIIEGVPAGFRIDKNVINNELCRRQQGYGRGGRMRIETDTVQINSGIRHGITLGSPICLEILNKDYENWKTAMSPEPPDIADEDIRSFTKLRPGHADYAGSVKYGFNDLRNVLERASARKTAAETAVGSIAKQILKEFGIDGFSTVTKIGRVENKKTIDNDDFPEIKRLSEISEVRCFDPEISEKMKEEIDFVKSKGDSVGGEFTVIYTNIPVGLGSYVFYNRAIDGLIAQAVMSIPAVKSVEIGAGKQSALLLGSEMHDPFYSDNGKIIRKTNNAGGIEGGMTNGEPLIVKAAMKPIPTMLNPLPTVDIKDGSVSESHFERSDTCAVPACAVVAEARIAIVLINEFLDKFGGDSLNEIKAHYEC